VSSGTPISGRPCGPTNAGVHGSPPVSISGRSGGNRLVPPPWLGGRRPQFSSVCWGAFRGPSESLVASVGSSLRNASANSGSLAGFLQPGPCAALPAGPDSTWRTPAGLAQGSPDKWLPVLVAGMLRLTTFARVDHQGPFWIPAPVDRGLAALPSRLPRPSQCSVARQSASTSTRRALAPRPGWSPSGRVALPRFSLSRAAVTHHTKTTSPQPPRPNRVGHILWATALRPTAPAGPRRWPTPVRPA